MKKEELFPGLIVEVRTDRPLVDGLNGYLVGGNTVSHLLARNPFSDPSMTEFILSQGDQVEVLHGPKRKQGINLVTVKNVQTGETGQLFWCEFKANMVMPQTLSPNLKFK